MANLSYALCPSCTKEAIGKTKVDELFGFRNNAGYIMVQSHCRDCRSRESVMRRRAGVVRPHKKKSR